MAKDEKTAKSDKDEKTAKSDYEFAQLAEMMGESAHQWQQSWSDWLGTGARIGRDQTAGNADEAGTPAVRFDPEKVLDAQAELWRDFQSLWLNTTARLMGQEAPAVIVPESGDHRFRDAEWNDNPLFDFFKQSYLLHSRWLCRTLADVEGLDERGVQGLEFMGRQIVDALAPTNFAHTNPAVLREARDTKGESLMRGMRNLAEDLKDSPQSLRPKADFPWFWSCEDNATDFAGGKAFDGNRWNDLHYTREAKEAAQANATPQLKTMQA